MYWTERNWKTLGQTCDESVKVVCYAAGMNRHLGFAFSLLVLALGGTVFAQGFNVRTGTWEFTMTLQGALPLEGVPPAVRAQLEAEMRKPQTYTSCVTAEDLKTLNLGKKDDSDDDNCKTVSSKLTATTGDIVRQCTGDEPRTDTVHYEASGPQAMKATVSSKSAKGATTMAMTGKWVSAQCKD
jgi:Protein of unknown function (DUF3617)